MKSILIVEDDPSIRECLVEILRIEGFIVNSACHGQEAIGLLSYDRPSMPYLYRPNDACHGRVGIS